jgi:hypothetical protein
MSAIQSDMASKMRRGLNSQQLEEILHDCNVSYFSDCNSRSSSSVVTMNLNNYTAYVIINHNDSTNKHNPKSSKSIFHCAVHGQLLWRQRRICGNCGSRSGDENITDILDSLQLLYKESF